MLDSSKSTLDISISQQLRKYCLRGYELYDQEDYKAAVRQFFNAWALLPKPQIQWLEAGWVLTALGDSYFKLGNFSSATESLKSALHCPDTKDNPFIHLRLGQCYFELEQTDMADFHLQTAYDLGGDKLFYKEDPSYIDLVKLNPSTKLKL